MTGSPVGCRRTSAARWSTVGVLGTAGALLSLCLMTPASAASPAIAGTWSSGPDQTYTDTTSILPGPTAYQTAVRAPINADGSSSFRAKRGVLPVQFDLFAAPTTTTTVTRTYDPPVWESILSDTDPADDYSFASFAPTMPIPLADLTNLSADYTFTTGDCHGGALRWSAGLDWTGDGASDGNVFVYYGDGPNFTDCTTNSQSGTNMRSLSDLRVDTSQVGGTFYDSWAGLAALHPDATLTRASLVLDGGWLGDQRADISNVTVNDNTWVPKTSEVISTTTQTGDFAKTCDLPDAKLQWAKDDSSPSSATNHAESIQPKGTGISYRQVDCKYLYNLAVSSLDGPGNYHVYANIGGTNMSDPAVFDLR
jgi:hypothetical protein